MISLISLRLAWWKLRKTVAADSTPLRYMELSSTPPRYVGPGITSLCYVELSPISLRYVRLCLTMFIWMGKCHVPLLRAGFSMKAKFR